MRWSQLRYSKPSIHFFVFFCCKLVYHSQLVWQAKLDRSVSLFIYCLLKHVHLLSMFGPFGSRLRHNIVCDDIQVRLRPLAGYISRPRTLGLSGQRASYVPTIRAYSTVPTLGRTVCQILLPVLGHTHFCTYIYMYSSIHILYSNYYTPTTVPLLILNLLSHI